MHRATPSASSASSSASHRSRRRQHLTREQLLKSLQILGPVSAPLPPELPPSPPASRESSPAPGHKRRHDSELDHGRTKKARVAPTPSSSRPRSNTQPHLSSTTATASSSSRHDAAEDGEVKEESYAGSSSAPPAFSFMPVRRPRRGDNVTTIEWDAVYEKCFNKARMLRFSALSRVAAAHPSTSKDYKPLRNPPNPSSSYAKDSLLMARLELIDSLLHFVYGLWCKDFSHNLCFRAAWRTVADFLHPTRKKLIAESHDEREKAFIGLLFMVDSYIHGRKLKYQAGAIDKENDSKITRLHIQWKAEKNQARAVAASQNTTSGSTPNMLPSPASSNSANSSNSTPIGGHGTPGHNPAMEIAPQPEANHGATAPERTMTALPPHLHIPVTTQYIVDRKSQSNGLVFASHYMQTAQQHLNLPVMARHFPRTLARMMFSTLGPLDEHEPDFQDDDCELFWPPQAITGEGLGWVCLMGMAMVKEFGKEYGYQGIDGVVPKQGNEDVTGFPEPRFHPHTR
ncbi:hypothetical protein C2E23DRAFT_879890 [Lenzites betulinus]|nr:hypothetical protein C2E23DRAFT_879890 [Lenzites betulinus]